MRIWLAMACAAVVVWATPVAAQPPPEAPPPEAPPPEAPPPVAPPPEPPPDPKLAEAKRLFVEADALRLGKQCERAIPLYLRSRELVVSVANTLNLALCYTATEREDEALMLYSELIATRRNELTAAELQAIGPEIARLRGALGEIDVSADLGATIVIDGRKRGVTPLADPIAVKPGPHEVQVLKDGFEPSVSIIHAKLGQTVVLKPSLRALASAGKVEVAGADLAGAELIVDGAPIGVLPFSGTLAAGTHTWQVIHGDQGTWPGRVHVVPGQTALLAPTVTPLGSRLEIRTRPEDARIFIAGVEVARGRWYGRLPIGNVTIEASGDGYLTATKKVDVSVDDRTQELRFDLERDTADPRWVDKEDEDSGSLWIEAFGGLGISPTLGSAAEQACSEGACRSDPAALGFVGGVRGGYELSFGLSFELAGGYVSLAKTTERTVQDGFTASDGADVAVDYQLSDALRLRGGFALGGVGYRLPIAGPFEMRAHLMLGMLVLSGRDYVAGGATAGGPNATVSVVDAGEAATEVGLLLSPELDAGFRFDALSFGAGIRVGIVPLGADQSALGDMFAVGSCDPTTPREVGCAPASAAIRGEPVHGSFVMITPAAHLGYRF